MIRRYRAFISYSWADKKWGAWLHRALETYRTPAGLVGKETPLGPAPRTLQPIFKDREEEAAGASIGASIDAAMAESEFLIVLCSPRSAQSKWVNREVAWFKRHRDPGRILALIVDGEPMASLTPGREAEECFPKTLLRKVDDALQPTDEAEDAPLAADARETCDGKRGARLKLAAALLGVGLDELIRRDERRRTARRRLVTAASLSLAAVLGGLSIFAFSQRDAAVRAQLTAQAAETRAVKARDDAEGLIELILTDLKSDLEGYGTLKSVTQIGNRAIGYYEGQDVKALTPDQLGRRARVLLMLGEADNKRGDLAAALARYEAAATTTSEQLARDPDNAQRIFDHAQSVFWVGYIAWQRGDHTKAKEHFTEYHRLATRLVGIDPQNDDYALELKYALTNLGTLAMDAGQPNEAETYFRRSLEASQALLARRPDDLDRVMSLGQSYAWLADALHRKGAFASARDLRQTEAQLYAERLRDNPGNTSLALKATTASLMTAASSLALGEIGEASAAADSAEAVALSLYEQDSSNAALLASAISALSAAAETRLRAGRADLAATTIGRASLIASTAPETMQDDIRWRAKALVQPALVRAQMSASRGDRAEAIAAYAEARDILSSAVAAGQADPTALRRYCAALAGRARLEQDAQAAWREIADRLGADERRAGPEALALLSEAYANIERREDAARIVRRLIDMKFRHPDFMDFLSRTAWLDAQARARAKN